MDTTDPDNLVLVYLRRLDVSVSNLRDDMREVKQRLGALEANGAALSQRLDRVGDRLDRIERRLELTEAT